MITDEIVQQKKELLKQLGDRIHQESHFCTQALNNLSDERILEKKWYKSLQTINIYSTTLIKCFIYSFSFLAKLPKKQFSYYVAKVAIINFLEIINAYEQNMNSLVSENKDLSKMLKDRINQKINIINENWPSDATGEAKKLKKDLINSYNRKNYEMNFIKDTLRKNSIIDDTDYEILGFAWDIRNSMHHNFLAIKDIDFKHSDIQTGKTYHFKFNEGDELAHVNDLIAYQVISVQIQFIFINIIQRLEKNKPTAQ